jgi:hypothetical protein
MSDLNTPLYKIIQRELGLYESRWPRAIAKILNILADEIETRGTRGLDLDPGETSDWLRHEASRVALPFSKT